MTAMQLVRNQLQQEQIFRVGKKKGFLVVFYYQGKGEESAEMWKRY